MSKGLKIFLMFLILVVFGAIAYFLLGGEDISLNVSPTSSPLATSTNEPISGLAAQTTLEIDADQIGQEFLTQLLNIRSIKLREDIFSRPAFVSLTDFTIELVQLGNEGRINPFAPFGVDGSTGALDMSMAPVDFLPGGGSSSAPVSGPGTVIPILPVQPMGQTTNTTSSSNVSTPQNLNTN